MANSFTPQQIEQFLQEFFDVVGARQYIGARYVPIFGRRGERSFQWDNGAPYEPLTVVMHQGASYVSRQYVPQGVSIANEDFWAQTYQFNAQIEQYRQAVEHLEDDVDGIREILESDYIPFPMPPNRYGTDGQVLSTDGLGSVNWVNPIAPTDAQAEEYISAWLDAHPEAVTTVQDNSVTDAKLIQSGGILSRVNDFLSKGDGLGLSVIDQYSAKFFDYVYQFIDNSTNVDDEIYAYNTNTGQMTIVTASNFGRVLPFVLGAGEYSSVLYGFYTQYSYAVDSTGVHKFRDKFPNVPSNGLGDFTVTEPTLFYISTTQSWTLVEFVNKNNIIQSYTPDFIDKKYYYCRLKDVEVDGRDIINIPTLGHTTNIEQAFVYDGRLTCNNDHPNANTSVAKYTKADLGSNLTKFMCRGRFKTLTNNASITLIATALDTDRTVQDIVRKSIHIGFNGSGCLLETYDNSVRTSHGSWSYAIQANTDYDFGWSIAGDTITMYLPNGTTQTVTDSSFQDYNGRYAIFEHFTYQTTATEEPTMDYGQPEIVGIYVTCEDGKPLRDNFSARPDGLPMVAPTGHVYTQFRNSATSGDTVYDAASGSVS